MLIQLIPRITLDFNFNITLDFNDEAFLTAAVRVLPFHSLTMSLTVALRARRFRAHGQTMSSVVNSILPLEACGLLISAL